MEIFSKPKLRTCRPHPRQPVPDLEPDGGGELPQAHRAEVAGLPEGLVVGVGAIHRAVVVDAVFDAEHVPDLVDHDSAGALQEELRPAVFLEAPKGWVVSFEREHTSPRRPVSNTKDKVP